MKPIQLSTVKTKPVEWLWYPYLPRGMITLLEGDPGVGKSWLSLDIAARVSTGTPWPFDYDSTGTLTGHGVLIITSEDPVSQVIRPRLEALNADLTKIFVEPGIFIFDDSGRQALIRTINKLKPSLIIIDPIAACLPKGLDAYRQNDVRQALAPLAEIADTFGLAVLMIRHWGKTSHANIQHKGLGSVDFMAIVRSAIACQECPDTFHIHMIHTKCNLGPKGPTLAFDKSAGFVDWVAEEVTSFQGGDHITIGGKSSGFSQMTSGHKISPLDKACRFLQDILRDGPIPANTVKARALDRGIRYHLLLRAKKHMGVDSVKIGEGGSWKWVRDG